MGRARAVGGFIKDEFGGKKEQLEVVHDTTWIAGSAVADQKGARTRKQHNRTGPNLSMFFNVQQLALTYWRRPSAAAHVRFTFSMLLPRPCLDDTPAIDETVSFTQSSTKSSVVRTA